MLFFFIILQEGMYSVIMTEERGITMRCSQSFGDRFFTTEEFQGKLFNLCHLCFFLWGK